MGVSIVSIMTGKEQQIANHMYQYECRQSEAGDAGDQFLANGRPIELNESGWTSGVLHQAKAL
jgi:hypothetical protein